MLQPYNYRRLCAFILVFAAVSLSAAAYDAKIVAAPDSEYFFPGQRVTFKLDLPEAVIHSNSFFCNWALFIKSQNGQNLRMPTPSATNKIFDVHLPRSGSYEVRCSYRFSSQHTNFSNNIARSFEVKYHDASIAASPEAAIYSPGETITFSIGSDNNYAPNAQEYFNWQIATRLNTRVPWQIVKKSSARTCTYTIPRPGEYQVYCSYRIMQGGFYAYNQVLHRKFNSARLLEGAIAYRRIGREHAGNPQVGERLLLSVEDLVELQKIIIPDLVNEERRTPIEPDSVKVWNWHAKAGSFDERRAFEKPLSACSKIWTAPQKPGWYDVGCEVDVFGDGSLTATFTRAIEVVKRSAPPKVATIEILAPSPINGNYSPRPTVLFSQLFVANTSLQDKKAIHIWEASSGSIDAEGKTAAWAHSCNRNDCPDSVTITCSLVSSGRTIAKGHGKFSLKPPTKRVTGSSEQAESDSAVSSATPTLEPSAHRKSRPSRHRR